MKAFKTSLLTSTIGAVALLGTAFSAQADISEYRIGVMAHDPGGFSSSKEEGVDINGELLFSPAKRLSWIGSPRPHVGITANTSGDTSFVYAGVTWDFNISDNFFFEASVGAAAHDGETEEVDPDRKALGCTVLFRESLSLGYNMTESVSVSFMLDHISNANICSKNEGMETAGLRLGVKF